MTNVKDFVFLDLVYNSITSTNLKEKILEHKDLLIGLNDHTLRKSCLEFIENNILKTKPKEYEKRIFLCLLLGYIKWNNQDSNKFPTPQIVDTLEKFQPGIIPEECYNILNITMITVIQLDIKVKYFNWLKLFKVASIIDPKFAFIEEIQNLHYDNERMNNFLREFIKHAKPVVNQIKDLKIYSDIGRVSYFREIL